MATILIIDDTPTNLGVMVGHLETQGYRVLIAQDGEEGLQRAELTHPDVILLDVMMPGPNGFEVCRKLKSRSSTRDIPVIFMTSLTETRDKVTGFAAGAVDYVTKPLQADEVIARIDTHLKLHAASLSSRSRTPCSRCIARISRVRWPSARRRSTRATGGCEPK